MESSEFREFGKAMVDFLIEYQEGLRDRSVLPDVEPGYLSKLLPEEAPEKSESWKDVLKDCEQFILPGMTHWSSPNFFAYYPTGNSYPAIVGEMLSAGLGCIGFSWMASPACTELEVITMNWLGKMLGLPKEFLNCTEGPGGGVIQGSASEATLICLLAAKERTIRRLKKLHPEWEESEIRTKLIAYSSDQSNSSVEKAGFLASTPMRLLSADEKCSLRGDTLEKAIQEDIENGLIPCYVCATLGTTGTCAFDNLDEIGPICQKYNMWLHIDAAYAGAAFACPEFRHLSSGIEFADSFNFNPHKWMLVNFDCSAMWVKDAGHLQDICNIDRIYLAHDKQWLTPDYRHWQIPLGRRFRSLKLWFVLRIYGIEGIQNHIRRSLKLLNGFEKHLISDERFEIVTKSELGLICFRLKGENRLTKELLARLNARRKIYVIAATYQEKFVIRFCIGSRRCEERDVSSAWKEISEQASQVLRSCDGKDLQTPEKKSNANEISSRIQDLNLEAKTVTQKIS
ncbi:3,4-dihydroxyphenylacetaldehyde synthase 2-like [Prorops nasuta]|uniref:3,4-dihydroxyphenylacetaldehyde synthase 2-like n=1 Tax=Prorops nasuta TaxID=863751 RepID=UPI0034CE2B36